MRQMQSEMPDASEPTYLDEKGQPRELPASEPPLPPRMRAKMRLSSVTKHDGGNETLVFYPVGPKTGYPADGSDEDNTYAKFSPSGKLELTVANPALLGKYSAGSTYYIDFTSAD